MIILILITTICLAQAINYRQRANKEYDSMVKEYRRENCDLHSWSYHPVSNKLECIKCMFCP